MKLLNYVAMGGSPINPVFLILGVVVGVLVVLFVRGYLKANNKWGFVGRVVRGLLAYSWLLIMVLIVLTPVLWMISAAFTRGKTIDAVPIIPDRRLFTLEHFKYIFEYKTVKSAAMADYPAAFLRTIGLAGLNTVLVLIFSTMSGFIFSRLRFKGRKHILLGMMVLQMFPSFMGMLALFMIFRTFGWLNNTYMLAVIYSVGSIPYNTFLVRGFMRSIPRSLDEAAEIDGASKMQTLFKIILPLIVPILGFIAINAFMAPWMDYMLQSVFLQADSQTVSVWLYRTTDPFNTLHYNPLRFMAGALLVAIPIMLVQFYMQKYMVYGLTAGAEKG